jgi:tetratricopeptide (TPR) repeat protein
LHFIFESASPELETYVLGTLGAVYRELGEAERAVEYHKKALGIAQTSKNRLEEAQSLVYLSEDYSYLGLYREAIDYARKCAAIFEEVRNQEGVAAAYKAIGEIAMANRDYSGAKQALARALAVAHAMGSKKDEILIYRDLGTLERQQLQWDIALKDYHSGLDIALSQDNRNDFVAAVIYNDIGETHEQQGNLARARESYRLARQTDPKNGIAANNYIRVGRLLAQEILIENQQEAGRYCAVAESAASTYTLSQCALALLQTDQPGQALDLVNRSLEKAQSRSEKAYTLYLKGSILTALDPSGDAKTVLNAALKEKPQTSLEADIHLALGLLEGDRRQFDKAKAVDPTIAQVSSVADLGSRSRRAAIPVPGDKERGVSLQQAYVPPIYRRLLINGQPVLLLVDTGAAYSLLNDESRARTGIRPLPETLQVAYADGRKEQLRRYRPDSIALPEQKGKSLKAGWVLGGSGKDNLLGRDLLKQMLSAQWFSEARGK